MFFVISGCRLSNSTRHSAKEVDHRPVFVACSSGSICCLSGQCPTSKQLSPILTILSAITEHNPYAAKMPGLGSSHKHGKLEHGGPTIMTHQKDEQPSESGLAHNWRLVALNWPPLREDGSGTALAMNTNCRREH